MLLNTLESLVLRTVTVERASLTVELPRHGPGYQADSQTPEILISRRHPSQGAEPTRMRPNDAINDDGVVKAVIGAGRSFCLASVPSRRSAVPVTARASGCPPGATREAGAAGGCAGGWFSGAEQHGDVAGFLQQPQARLAADAPHSPAGITAAKPTLIAKATNRRMNLAAAALMRVTLVRPGGGMFKRFVIFRNR